MSETEKPLRRKGRLVQGEGGAIILINEKNEGYRVNEIIAFIWYECEGKTENELVDLLSDMVDLEKEIIRKDVHEILSKLKEVELVETV
jgi:hypothetical protein